MRSPRSLLSALALGALLSTAGPASAQFRPAPLTEAQRLTNEADDAQTDATKLLKSGDKSGAEEKFRKAVELYEKALASDPEQVAAAAGLGAAAGVLGDYARVAKALAPVAQAHPDDADVSFQLGVALFKLQRFDEALPLLEKVSPLKKPEHLIGHYYLGTYYLRQQRPAQSVAEFNRYLELRPQELAPKDPEIFQYLGNAYLLLRRPDYARTSFERAQRGLAKESVPIQLGLVSVLELEGKPKDAMALLDGVISRNPSVPEPRERLGRLLLASGDLARAEQVANDLVKLQSTTGSQLLLGDVKLARKQGAAAEAALRKALQLTPGHLPSQISLAKAIQLQGRNDEAIALLEAAAKAGADSVDVWAVLGSVNRRAGHIQRAVEMHKRVVELAPQLSLGYRLLGADHFSTGQWEQAVEDYEQALSREPRSGEVKHWLSMALQHRARARADASRLDEAVPDLRRALDLDPTAQAARNLAAVLMSQRDYRDAQPALERGTKLPGAGWRDYEMFGYALLGMGETKRAVDVFEQALGMTQEAQEQSEINAGWALAKAELGEFDAAVQRLSEASTSKLAAKVADSNLALVLVRRALARASEGDAPAAAKDLEQARKLSSSRDTDVQGLMTVARALVDAEEGRYADASAQAKKALGSNPRWALPNAKSVFDAYVAYRQGRFGDARKAVGQLGKKADPKQTEWGAQLARAINRREGEKAYQAGSMAGAEKALKAALAADPHNPWVQHNLACVQYRKGKSGQEAAVAAWQKVEGQVPEATFNLGIDAQESKRDVRRAVGYYRRYLANGGGVRTSQAREWKERLQGLYGVSDAAATAAGSDEVNP